MNWYFWIFFILLAIYLVFVVGPAVVAFHLLFSRKKAIPLEERDLSSTYLAPYETRLMDSLQFLKSLHPTEVSARLEDGICLKADYYDGGFEKTAIFFHGYMAEPMINFCVQGHDLYLQRYNLLMVHQRGHGKSGGNHTTLGMNEKDDVLLWVDWVEKNTETKRIILYGMSMGAAAVSYASEAVQPSSVQAMVIDCGYRSPYEQFIYECQVRSAPWQPIVPIVLLLAKRILNANMRKKTSESLKNTQIPALFLIGTADKTVSLAAVEECYECCASEKEMIIVEGAAHTTTYLAGSSMAKERLTDFLSRNLS